MVGEGSCLTEDDVQSITTGLRGFNSSLDDAIHKAEDEKDIEGSELLKSVKLSIHRAMEKVEMLSCHRIYHKIPSGRKSGYIRR